MTVTIALFTRDLRVHDNPMLAAAATADAVVPLFVHDEGIRASAPRTRFLAETLADLDTILSGLGGRLIVRRGSVVEEVCRLAEEVDAAEVHISADVSSYAQHRERRLAEALGRRALCRHDDVITVLAPGSVTPASSDHFAVFTPYFRRWEAAPKRALTEPPTRLRLPSIAPGPHSAPRHRGPCPGGETEARRRAQRWFDTAIADYHLRHDDLAEDGTSRLSPYLHFGCLSPRELTAWAHQHPSDGAAAFVRQLAWRDFHHQVLAARPGTAHADYRPRGDQWREDQEELLAWQEGRTGIPIVDAGMRQLLNQAWMHNRARLITGSFLTKTCYLDWRAGARHFFEHLLDADVANNCLNWQWVAGTGTDTRPNRVLNPLRQAGSYDPRGDYVRRWVPELADLPVPAIHRPWTLGDDELRRRDYPAPIVDLDQARERFRRLRT